MGARRLRDLPPDVQAAMREATEFIQRDPTGNIHTAYWGEKIANGQPMGRMGIVFGVARKARQAGVPIQGSPLIPPLTGSLVTDVVQQAPASIELLRLDTGLQTHGAQNVHQQCRDCPIPGGVQIQPEGQSWVGTAGCALIYRDPTTGRLCRGLSTNWHVATGDVGRKIHQPTSQKPWIGRVARSPGVSFTQPNYVDLAIIDIERTDGPYAPLTHTVKPEQITLGTYSKKISTGGVGTRVARDGRTLGGIDDGVCTQVGVSVRVGYGAGKSALFLDQMEFKRAGGGSLSAPGDSGSQIFEYPAMEPFAKLFAGGGGVTIGSPVEYMLENGVHSFQ